METTANYTTGGIPTDLLQLLDQRRDKADSSFSSEMTLPQAKRTSVTKLSFFIEDSFSAAAKGNVQTIEAIRQWALAAQQEIDLIPIGSLGLMSQQPVIGIQLPGRNRLYFGPVMDYQVPTLCNAVMRQYVPEEILIGQWYGTAQAVWEGIPDVLEHPFFAGQERRILALNGIINPWEISDYIAWGGYQAFHKAIRSYSQEDLVTMVGSSQLMGRSGSGYPALSKWEQLLSVNARKRYVICNADESDPGSFMHRVLMEGNPHLIIEGLMLTAYAIGAGEAIIYTRSRYIQTVKRLEQAIAQVKAIKLLGEDILESGYSLNVHIRKGPGAYVCGEETALIASIEGKRGMPRPKPPYPAEKGLFGYPTLVHNVETIAQLPGIVAHGPVWYRSAGTETSSGTKLYSLSGKFKQQGVLELPFGYTLEQLIYQNAGGTKKGKAVKAVLAGGPLGKFVMPDQFQLSMDYSSYREQNLMLGSGSLILLDEKSCPINLLAHILEFLKQESCGKCIPCREGSKRMSDVLNAVTRKSTGEHSHAALHRFKGLTQLEQLAQVIQETSLCGLGKGAPRPLLSALDCFRDEFEEHVFNRVCPAGVCQDLRTFSIDADACTGCYLCFSKCPEQAIIGSPRQTHVIVADRCTGCGLCAEVCMFNAVKVQ